MPLPNNQVILASAGSRKTTHLVSEALALGNKRILITTYTNENLRQICNYFVEQHGYVPNNVTLVTWYVFLLQDCVRPYQSSITSGPRISSIVFDDLPDAVRFIKKGTVDRYYLTRSRDLYRDRAAEFAFEVDKRSQGLVIKRLERIYDHIFLDEVQDLAAYDLEILDKLFQSNIPTFSVGDPRQAIFSTNRGSKNKK